MAHLTALTSAPPKVVFLGEQDLILIRQQAEDVDAVYGETLPSLLPEALDGMTRRPRAA